jgi:WhiB family redox-sensing transcriptional regulator
VTVHRAQTLTRPTNTLEHDTPDEWRTRAACRGKATAYDDPWHPDGQGVKAREHAAKALCSPCPVRAECLAYALQFEGELHAESRFGVFGGKTPSERAKLRPRPPQKAIPVARPECGQNKGYRRHMREREQACEPCRRAHAAHMATERATRGGAA